MFDEYRGGTSEPRVIYLQLVADVKPQNQGAVGGPCGALRSLVFIAISWD